MRLSELLGSEVVGDDGAILGAVVDVLAVQDGPILQGGVDASLRVEGLVVGRDGVGVRLGFHRAGVKGPWLLRAVLGALDRRCLFIGWDRVQGQAPGRVVVAGAARDYGAPPSLAGAGPVRK